ncbi:hypothetical protein QO002_006198 [Pararhizobium capsulatum DSM 1112]|uniref:Uncharacterized protein n=1 Tax=Pararhizobium capsulatum DSM 1112 TaxID=1121113 RepID=A0ABU0C252_9HYPH|nr:hypothetical protein [Pararhizobium capsulatum]MDQ0323991.1 hypothetical protein [Pararhizobium capsulatum DSM 1112]
MEIKAPRGIADPPSIQVALPRCFLDITLFTGLAFGDRLREPFTSCVFEDWHGSTLGVGEMAFPDRPLASISKEKLGDGWQISRRFAMVQSQLECADIDRLLHNFATSLEHHQIAKRLSSLKAALAALQPSSPERTFLRRIFGF